MNLLFLESSILPNNGGIERVTSLLASYFKTFDIQVYYMFYCDDDTSISDNNKLKFDLAWEYNKFKEKSIEFIKGKNINIIINQDLNFPNITLLYKEIKLLSPQILIIDCIHNPPDLYKYSPMTYKHKLKDALCRIMKGYSINSKLWRDMYDIVDYCIMLSDTFLPIAKREYGKTRQNKMRIIPNPLPFEIDHPIDYRKKKKQFLIVSRLDEHQKNLTSALRIWQKFENINHDYNLVLAGYGKDEQMLVDYIAKLGLKRINFIGKTEDPRTLYAESRFFMMTSRYEGFGMTLVEAQQYGCIPFAFNSYPALNDIIINDKTGFIIRAFDEKSYYKKMLYAVNCEEDTLQQISYNAYCSSKKFSIKTVGKLWIDLFFPKSPNRKL